MVKQKKTISRSIEHQQESIKGNWSSSEATEHTKECHGNFDWLYPKTLSIKNRYYDRKVRELLEIDMAVVRHWQDKVLNRDNGNFVKTNVCKSLFNKMKILYWNLTSFCIERRLCVVFWSIWKRLQSACSKYLVVNNIICVVLLPTLMFDISYMFYVFHIVIRLVKSGRQFVCKIL